MPRSATTRPGRPTIDTQHPCILPAAFTHALAYASNSVSIVTTDGSAGRAGLTVSSVCSVCAEPALMLACVNHDNEFCTRAEHNGCFAINLLNSSQSNVSNVFAGLGVDPEAERFDTGDWTHLHTGAPILVDALVGLDCQIESTSSHGTHRIFIGRVVSLAVTDGEPLVYQLRQYGRTIALDPPAPA